jgi:PIN domain nuclease of toxin-antitoxin system
VRRLGLSTCSVTPTMAFAAYDLPEPFHRDPADRLIVATARLLQVPVVTSDQRILTYAVAGHVAAVPY